MFVTDSSEAATYACVTDGSPTTSIAPCEHGDSSVCCYKKGPLYWFSGPGFGPRGIFLISSEHGRKARFGFCFPVLVGSHPTPITNCTRKIGPIKKEKTTKKGCNTRTFEEVTHPSTTHAQVRRYDGIRCISAGMIAPVGFLRNKCFIECTRPLSRAYNAPVLMRSHVRN